MEIIIEQQKKLKEIGKKHKIKLAMIFGSRAKGNPKEDSDLDIAFIFFKDETKYRYYYGELFADLGNVFRGYNIDLLNLRDVDYFVKYEVARNSRLIIGEPLDYCEFRARANRIYKDSFDLRKLNDILLEKKHRLLKEKIYA
ncbi:MAG: nucleotidyltransferase domain-containing protein [bacterium]